jgi:hypothetical protein
MYEEIKQYGPPSVIDFRPLKNLFWVPDPG